MEWSHPVPSCVLQVAEPEKQLPSTLEPDDSKVPDVLGWANYTIGTWFYVSMIRTVPSSSTLELDSMQFNFDFVGTRK